MAEQLVAAPDTFAREADKRLFHEARRVLWEYEPLRATHPQLNLTVEHGVVRISGRVRTLAMKEIASYLLRRLPGVVRVQNELLADTELVRRVADVLAADPDLGPLCLRVDARDGVVTLAGDIPHPELEERALAVARRTPEVLDVISQITVRPPQRPPTAPAKKPEAPESAPATADSAASNA